MPVRALLFDFDGTIVDTESVDLKAWEEVFEAHGVPLPHDRLALRIGTLGGPDELDELERAVGGPVDRGRIVAERHEREQELLEREPLREGVREYVDEARRLGLRLGIVSSGSRSWIDGNLKRLGVDGVWSCIVSADGDVERAKPSPTMYREAVELLGVAPGEAVAFEDSPNGVAAAVAAGIFCVAIPNPATKLLDLDAADLLLVSLVDVPLPKLLEQIP